MKLILAILFPPGYFFAVGPPLAGIIHLLIWCMSLVLLVFGIGIFMYFVQVICAVWDMRQRMTQRFIQQQATAIADKMADKLTATQSDLVSSPLPSIDRPREYDA